MKCLGFSATDEYLVSGGMDRVCRVWNVVTCETKWIMTDHRNTVSCLAYIPDHRNLMVSGSYDKTAIVWDIRIGESIEILRVSLSIPILLIIVIID